MSHPKLAPVGQGWAGFGLTVTVGRSDRTRCDLGLGGELDAASAPLLGGCLAHYLGTGYRFVRVNCSGLTFLDTCGLEMISTAHRAFLARRGTLILTGLSARSRRITRLTRLDTVLLIAADIADVSGPPDCGSADRQFAPKRSGQVLRD